MATPEYAKCPKCKKPTVDDASFCAYCGKRLVPLPRRVRPRTEGQGSITKLSDDRAKPYWARLPAEYDNLHVQRRSIGCYKTYKEAAEALAKAMYVEQESAQRGLTLGDLYEGFIETKYFAQLTPQSQAGHRNSWRDLQAAAKVPVKQINRDTLQQIIDTAEKRGLKRETLAKIRNLASMLCREAMAKGLLTVNYGQLVQLPRSDSKPVQPFSADEIAMIWDATDSGDKTAQAVILLIYTGLRPGELLSMRIEENLHITGQNRYLRGGSKTEAGRDRIIPLPPVVHPVIDALVDGREDGYLIPADGGKRYDLNNWRNRCYNKLMARLKLEGHTPYSCRHTYADLQKRRRVSPEIMMEVMGHTDYSTTVENYHTTTDEDIGILCDAVSEMTRPQPKKKDEKER